MSIGERSVNQPEEQPSPSERRPIRRTKLKELQDAGRGPSQTTKFVVKHHSANIKEGFEVLEGAVTSMASRVMSKRSMGKAIFCDLQDDKGHIQLYVRVDEPGEEAFIKFKKTDIGDIVGMEGEVFKTRRGEISIKAHKVALLSRSFQPLPEKLHSLTDEEMRYRQRYVDLIMNEDVRHAFRIRTAFIGHMRRCLDERDYLGVETPVLNTISDDATARPFITHHNTLDIDMYTRIAAELNLERLAVGGFERVYGIDHISRNEGMDPKHNPEFTTIEFYEAYADFHDMMDIAEGVLSTAAKEILGSYRVTWLGNEIDLAPGWKRMTIIDAVRGYTSVDFEATSDDEEAYKAAEAGDIDLEGCERIWGTAPYEVFNQRVKEKLIRLTFITMYPVEVPPLTRRSPKDPRLTERFELFIDHCELANAFSGLDDPVDQCGYFEHELALREVGNNETNMMDEDFINVLEYGLLPASGMDIGINRYVMLPTDSDSIRDVVLSPTMKLLDKPESTKYAVAGANCAVPAAKQGLVNSSKVEVEPLFQKFVDFETFVKSGFWAVKVKECTAVSKSKELLRFVLDDDTGEGCVILSSIHDTHEPEELAGKTLIAIINLPPCKMMGIDSCGMTISTVRHEEGVEKLHYPMVDDHVPAGAKLY